MLVGPRPLDCVQPAAAFPEPACWPGAKAPRLPSAKHFQALPQPTTNNQQPTTNNPSLPRRLADLDGHPLHFHEHARLRPEPAHLLWHRNKQRI